MRHNNLRADPLLQGAVEAEGLIAWVDHPLLDRVVDKAARDFLPTVHLARVQLDQTSEEGVDCKHRILVLGVAVVYRRSERGADLVGT